MPERNDESPDTEEKQPKPRSVGDILQVVKDGAKSKEPTEEGEDAQVEEEPSQRRSKLTTQPSSLEGIGKKYQQAMRDALNVGKKEEDPEK